METGIHAMAGHVEQYRNGFSFRKYLCGNVSGYLDVTQSDAMCHRCHIDDYRSHAYQYAGKPIFL